MHLINKVGLEEIRQQLIKKLKPNRYDFQADEMIGSREQDNYLSSYASDIEEAMDDWTNNGEVELSMHQTKSGHVEHLSVSEQGFYVDRANLDKIKFNSIQDVVREITEKWSFLHNDDESFDAAHIAGTYALEAAEETRYGIDQINIEAHLEILVDAGGKFDVAKALYFAEKIVKGEQE